MPTQKQINANRANGKLSTGPKTAAGKEASAANAMTHGMTAEKYLTNSESVEEFEAEYAGRRKLYPPNDAIIDKLVRKIILAHFRIDRGFEAEVEMIDNANDSLAQVLVQYDKPMKHLTGYEASNRRTLKLLEEELARYVSMLKENGATDVTNESEPREPKGRSTKKKTATNADTTGKAPVLTPTASGGSRDRQADKPPKADAQLALILPINPRPTIGNNASPDGSPTTIDETDDPDPTPPKPTGGPAYKKKTPKPVTVSKAPVLMPTSSASPNGKPDPMSAKGNQIPIARQAATSASRGETTTTTTSPPGSAPPPTSAGARNPNTNPISSNSASPMVTSAAAENQKTEPIPESTSNPIIAPAAPLTTSPISVPPPPSPIPPCVRTGHDLNNWRDPPRQIPRR